MPSLTWRSRTLWRCEIAWPTRDFCFARKLSWHWRQNTLELFVPKYAMVTFHRIPYATALKRGQLQDRMLTELCDPIKRIEELDWKKADKLIRSQLTPLELVS